MRLLRIPATTTTTNNETRVLATAPTTDIIITQSTTVDVHKCEQADEGEQNKCDLALTETTV